jgi:transcriptional regulator with XRE-family HTH domain
MPTWKKGLPLASQPHGGEPHTGRISRETREVHNMGLVIRTRRMMLGMTQTELGRRLGGISFQQIQKYETGDNGVPPGRIGMLCRALEVTPNQLLGWTDDMLNGSLISIGALRAGRAIHELPATVRNTVQQLVHNLTEAIREQDGDQKTDH